MRWTTIWTRTLTLCIRNGFVPTDLRSFLFGRKISEMTSTKTLLFLKIESGSKKRQKAPKPCVKHQILSGFRANYYRISRKRETKFELLHCYSSGTFLFLEIESGSKKRRKAAKRCVKSQILRGFRANCGIWIAKFCVHMNETRSSFQSLRSWHVAYFDTSNSASMFKY